MLGSAPRVPTFYIDHWNGLLILFLPPLLQCFLESYVLFRVEHSAINSSQHLEQPECLHSVHTEVYLIKTRKSIWRWAQTWETIWCCIRLVKKEKLVSSLLRHMPSPNVQFWPGLQHSARIFLSVVQASKLIREHLVVPQTVVPLLHKRMNFAWQVGSFFLGVTTG